MNDQLWWYVARASGLVGWALLAASVIWGLLLSTKTRGPRVRPNWVLDLHRFLGGAAVIFTGVHVTGLVLDSYVHFGPAEVLVPLASEWRPGPVAWGIVAMYLLVTIELTSLARRRLSKRVWRTIHFSSFPLYVVATVHALSAGTEASGWAFRGAAIAASAVTAALTIKRVREARAPAPVRRPPVRERQLVS